mmetsp:Transcript_12300/g.15207  ORF Transcript_12300/g.15207 Transcript_12300/m.15207 type:complete len:83 (+) Transcript_12300:21-269(+)
MTAPSIEVFNDVVVVEAEVEVRVGRLIDACLIFRIGMKWLLTDLEIIERMFDELRLKVLTMSGRNNLVFNQVLGEKKAIVAE